MPLLDHFHPPVSESRHWESFHSGWAYEIAAALNKALPERFFAEATVHPGPRVEVDVATYEDPSSTGGTALLTQPAVSAPTFVIPAEFPPGFTVAVFSTFGGHTLVASIELVSPANKDRPATRTAFAAKCASYLHQGVSLIVVDIVTERHGRPPEDLLALLGQTPNAAIPDLSAASYIPVRDGDDDFIEVRLETLTVGGVLPTMPLSLGAGRVVAVNLEETYEEVRRRKRM